MLLLVCFSFVTKHMRLKCMVRKNALAHPKGASAVRASKNMPWIDGKKDNLICVASLNFCGVSLEIKYQQMNWTNSSYCHSIWHTNMHNWCMDQVAMQLSSALAILWMFSIALEHASINKSISIACSYDGYCPCICHVSLCSKWDSQFFEYVILFLLTLEVCSISINIRSSNE